MTSAPRLVRSFTVPSGHGRLVEALWDLTAEGLVEPTIDGVAATRDVLVPGWTSYEWRLRVVTCDVTDLLGPPGTRHELGLLLGNGWYCGRLAWDGMRGLYGQCPGAVAVLRLRFADGTVHTVATDETWEAVESSVLADDLYDGETIDAGGPASTIRRPVEVAAVEPTRLQRTYGPPIVRHERVSPVTSTPLGDGSVLLDFGQNLVGWLRVRATGPAGHRIVATHAEVVVDGELATRPLRSARATDVFVLSGGEDTFEPTFTFHGFRYARLEGWAEVEGSVEAVVVGSDLRRTGTFACSDPLVSRFHENVVWSLRGNTVGIPTDCPQRDERLGWTGDIAVFAPTACYLFDMAGFLRDWLADLRAEQDAAGGRVPYVVPDPLKGWSVREGEAPESTAIWSDAAVWVPWALWEAGGDLEVLRESYPSMAAHLTRVLSRLSPRGVWEGDFQFGDWLDPTAPPEDPTAAIADPDVIASAALHRSLHLTARVARALGLAQDAARWDDAAARLRAAFTAAYVGQDGTIRSDAPAVYALAVVARVLSPEQTVRAGQRLAELVRAAGHRIIAGFAGTPFLCDALTETGHLDDAYALLLNRASPSWLHPVELGATTVWERWDALLDDGSINPGEMTSFNHYALGAVADWIHRTVVGIAPAEPGYARVRIDPRPGGSLTWAQGGLETPHGLVAVRWRTDPEPVVEYCAPAGVDVELGAFAQSHGRRLAEEELRSVGPDRPAADGNAYH